MSWGRSVVVSAAILCWTGLSAAQGPAKRAPSAAKKPKTNPATIEYRFDALRIDGTLHGPEALDVRSMTGGKRGPLLKRRRSFVNRIFETLEDPTLHGG